MHKSNTNLPCPGNFIDLLLERLDLKNDAQLARALHYGPPQISKLRNGIAPLTADALLRIHEAGQIPIAEIRKMARLPAPEYPEWFDVVTTSAKRLREIAAQMA
jgi:transcriptional regulator with XRE-family HTH domain